MLDIKRLIKSAKQTRGSNADVSGPVTLESPFAPTSEVTRSEHPHPQFCRDAYTMLNGTWTCAFEKLPSIPHPTIAARTASAASAPTLAMPAEFWRTLPRPDTFDMPIRVPFSPEAPASGVGRQLQPDEVLWYRCQVPMKAGTPNDRVLLHFEAVDWMCGCFVNGSYIGQHVGAYLPFCFDITSWTVDGPNDIMLAVIDPSERGTQLRGKQQLQRGGIWYTAQSGIWQPVWIERVPAWHMRSASIAGDIAGSCFRVDVQTSAPGMELHAQAFRADGSPAGPVAEGDHGSPSGLMHIEVPVDQVHLWNPEDPYLYRIELAYGSDWVHSYGAFRTVSIEAVGERQAQGGEGNGVSEGAGAACGPAINGDPANGVDGGSVHGDAAASCGHAEARDASGRFDTQPRVCLNGRPIFLKGLLDQGYWPESLMTAPSDAAMVADIELARALGFNMVRKHIKIAPERWYYHCDRLGMLVLQDIPNGGGPWNAGHVNSLPNLKARSWDSVADDTPAAQAKMPADDPIYQAEWRQTCERAMRALGNHPSIIGWTLFNEGWGQFDAAAAYERARRIDPTRPIDATSGWFDQGVGDFHSVHNYFRPLAVFPDKAAARHPDARTACNTSGGRAELLSEFGGVASSVPGHTWPGLPRTQPNDQAESEAGAHVEAKADPKADPQAEASVDPQAELWRREVRQALAQADELEHQGLAGYVYTQLTDVEGELNGLLTYDRRINKLTGERIEGSGAQGTDDEATDAGVTDAEAACASAGADAPNSPMTFARSSEGGGSCA